eukprot:TRINITY_DN27267_c0_g1_i1.p1 TRINITY_DN27267_c0_g1~~TRINITY_DN27267_c0_g1_i1.p1  ORF type:complete len:562 (+),score=231.47 TRINITY_DN27267_c0_g1_i1:108-1793(+)
MWSAHLRAGKPVYVSSDEMVTLHSEMQALASEHETVKEALQESDRALGESRSAARVAQDMQLILRVKSEEAVNETAALAHDLKEMSDASEALRLRHEETSHEAGRLSTALSEELALKAKTKLELRGALDAKAAQDRLVSRLYTKLAQLEGENGELRSKLGDALQQLAEAEEMAAHAAEAAADANVNKASLLSTIEASEGSLEARATQLTTVSNQLQHTIAARDEQTVAAEAARQDITRLRVEIERLHEESEDLQAVIVARDASLAAAKVDHTAAMSVRDSELAAARRDAAAHKAEAEQLQMQVDALDRTASEQSTALAQRNVEGVELRGTIEQLELRCKTLVEKAEAKDRRMAAQADEAAAHLARQLARQAEDHGDALARLERQRADEAEDAVRQLDLVREDAAHELQHTVRKLEQSHATNVDEHVEKVKRLEDESVQMAEALKALRAERAALVAATADAEEAAAAATADAAASSAALEEAKAVHETQLARCIAQLSLCSSRSLSLELSAEEAATRATSLERQLHDASAQLEKTHRELRASSPSPRRWERHDDWSDIMSSA